MGSHALLLAPQQEVPAAPTRQHCKPLSMKRFVLISTLLTLGTVGIATVAFAADFTQDFVPLSPNLPIIGRKITSLPELFNALLTIGIVLSAVLAVVMVAIGGIQYMTTDSVFQMTGAKERISNAIIGLLIVLMAVLILQTINPELVKLKLFDSSTYK